MTRIEEYLACNSVSLQVFHEVLSCYDPSIRCLAGPTHLLYLVELAWDTKVCTWGGGKGPFVAKNIQIQNSSSQVVQVV